MYRFAICMYVCVVLGIMFHYVSLLHIHIYITGMQEYVRTYACVRVRVRVCTYA